MFFKKYKEKAAYKILKKKLAYPTGPKGTSEAKRISSVACLVNLDEFDDVEALRGLSHSLEVDPEHFHILGFSGKNNAYESPGIPVMRKTDLGWKGKIRHEGYSGMKDRHYDLLLNYYSVASPVLALASTGIGSSFRAGLAGVYEKMNDLIINVSPENFPEFKRELVKYLTILNKI
ncbi:DUF6913 domain-containing protein [Sinomicrobium soli]|uniref:DUF6913 domain-containing protein n=1 Tax=Sinomicrobium sp. N-1-3-6 TaxID=2219864 RepID=UPI000DCB3713|nr:hypothetical protein [Sinomicrobium sp. N-1-3-6]RAV30138.1 hypothetical protein DN748_04905 [Sinomicrobium sp. N-1-3-6]